MKSSIVGIKADGPVIGINQCAICLDFARKINPDSAVFSSDCKSVGVELNVADIFFNAS
jgi:hypothetical protein